MKRWTRWLSSVAVVVVVSCAGAYGLYRYKNPPPQLAEPNHYNRYKTQDRAPVGKIGILVTQLVMPETFRAADYYNIALKSTQYIPWPFQRFAVADRGVVLLDRRRFYEFEEFEPTELVDLHGGSRDVDGVHYLDKWRRGEVRWVPPNPSQHLDHGYFLLTTRKQGVPTISAKLMTKAKVFYYDYGFANHRLPHEAGMRSIAERTLAQVQSRHGTMPWRFVTSDNFGLLRDAVRELLDQGVDTLIIAPAVPIYSHHEEFNGSFRHALHEVEEWQREPGHRAGQSPVKVIFAPQLGDFPVLRQAYLRMLRDRLDKLPTGKEVDVRLVVSVHGMPWDFVPHEAWLDLAPAYRDAMLADAKQVLDGYDFGRREVVLAQDHFADPVNNPKGNYLSTNQAFRDAIAAKFDYAINLPIEFFAENTDTMFSHAMFNFEGFPGYSRYESIHYDNWNEPYTREFLVEGTRVIYNGLPVGRYSEPIVQAHVASIEAILAQRAP
jgi:protoheme ferro-lyase